MALVRTSWVNLSRHPLGNHSLGNQPKKLISSSAYTFDQIWKKGLLTCRKCYSRQYIYNVRQYIKLPFCRTKVYISWQGPALKIKENRGVPSCLGGIVLIFIPFMKGLYHIFKSRITGYLCEHIYVIMRVTLNIHVHYMYLW